MLAMFVSHGFRELIRRNVVTKGDIHARNTTLKQFEPDPERRDGG